MSTSHSGVKSARQLGTLLGLLGLGCVLWILTPHFLTVSNLLNVLEQSAINAIVAAGMTFAIISGGIDLSVGSVLALSGVVLASLLQAGAGLPLALTLALATAALCGLLNGVIVTLGRLPPFIATLGMMSVARGLALIWAEGRPISGFDETFRLIATGRPLGDTRAGADHARGLWIGARGARALGIRTQHLRDWRQRGGEPALRRPGSSAQGWRVRRLRSRPAAWPRSY